MASKMGIQPHHIKCTATNLQVNTDGNVIYNSPCGFHVATTVDMANAAATLTAQETLNGFLLVDPNGGAQALTLPTAALLVAAMKGVTTNTSLRLIIRNTANGAETITTTASTITISGTATIAQNATAEYIIVLTNVTPGNEAGVCYTIASDHVH